MGGAGPIVGLRPRAGPCLSIEEGAGGVDAVQGAAAPHRPAATIWSAHLRVPAAQAFGFGGGLPPF